MNDVDTEQLKTRLREIVRKVQTLGASTIEVDYDGIGDSGGIDAVRLYADGRCLPNVAMPRKLENSLDEAILQLLSWQRPGWELDAGSCGTVIIDIDAMTIDVEHRWREESADPTTVWLDDADQQAE